MAIMIFHGKKIDAQAKWMESLLVHVNHLLNFIPAYKSEQNVFMIN